MDNISENDGNRGPANSNGSSFERLNVVSGEVLLIDQFMLANQQFISAWKRLKKDSVRRFRGALVELPVGGFKVYRDAARKIIVFFPDRFELVVDGGTPEDGEDKKRLLLSDIEAEAATSAAACQIGVETKALVAIDTDALFDDRVISDYQRYWRNGNPKGARDYLRNRGASVRYGFSKESDSLKVVQLAKDNVTVLLS